MEVMLGHELLGDLGHRCPGGAGGRGGGKERIDEDEAVGERSCHCQSPATGFGPVRSWLKSLTSMEDGAIPSISSGSVGSRFVSQNELDDAKARRDEQWRQAYARCAGPGSPVQYALNA
jgi:hypothetical protein